ncbi:hypothetical protein [Deinococcus yunweiensis]|uniref:hypothetical protein n=1 Tax=Deinococcus yunweiensis TaxID=367282 RepID=UPI00398E5DBB
MSIVNRLDVAADATDIHAAVLQALVTSQNHDMTPCVHAFSTLLFTLAGRYSFPDPEQAVYLALADIQRCCPTWRTSRLPARVWVLATAKRRFDHLARNTVPEFLS